MKAFIADDQINVLFGRGEFEQLKQNLATGQYLIFSDIPIEGVKKLILFGTNPSESLGGNLRCMVCSDKDATVNYEVVREFMSQIGVLFGYKGAEDFGRYEDLTDAQIHDAMTGRGEFPLRGGGPESEL
ncbi:hypothetical protein HY948_01505 [Candidatus Gottesmanbacteria bacterium]|nr:hypothetical protein [Candidatus Gottesmanbacteria bacterium]